ncbi:MAG TPA: hypothetical protein QF480_03990, partial [Bacteroidales bacterium]|jgi:hypothetical protein|nr:hypothetical protein [Bacteroidales bacterium]|tara:strand:- start:444 stop:794 length:351 start_codon:yes stop_codon:yes gene_type:complete
MKSRIATFLIAVNMFLTGTAFAANPVTKTNNASKEVSTLLKQELKYPKFAKDSKFECCVLVRLTINKDGTFKVDCINCTSPIMKAHVTKAIEKISRKELARYAGMQICYKINYKLI